MGTQHDKNALHGHVAQGDAEYILGIKAKYDHDSAGNVPMFIRVVVLEVISDPAMIDETKLSFWEHELKVGNIKYAAVAPRNAIIAKRVLGNDASASEKTMVLYPFFPPHIAFPAKPGEHVWAVFEQPDAKVNEIGYWMCRIVDPNFVEDVNQTHSNRQFDKSFRPSIKDTFDGTDDPKYEFQNGVIDTEDGERYTVAGTASIDGDEKSYERLLKDTDASKIVQYEAVPRYRKRPGDIAFEGTNNTLIVLGTDRTGPVSDYDTDQNKGKIPKPTNDDISTGAAGSIDIVVGRGQTDETLGKEVENSLGRKELGKSKKELADKEGDVDFKTDSSRILVAMKTKVDKNLKLDGFNKSIKVKTVEDSSGGDAVIVAKSDKVRIVGRSDVELLVTGIKKVDGKGHPIEKTSPSDWAAFIINSEGTVYAQPAKGQSFDVETDTSSFKVNPQNIEAKTATASLTVDPATIQAFASMVTAGDAGATPVAHSTEVLVALAAIVVRANAVGALLQSLPSYTLFAQAAAPLYIAEASAISAIIATLPTKKFTAT